MVLQKGFLDVELYESIIELILQMSLNRNSPQIILFNTNLKYNLSL
jgi:hypothetical protein